MDLNSLSIRISRVQRVASYILGGGLCCLLVFSCKTKVDKQIVAEFVEDADNGLKKEIKSGEYKISITYRPTELLITEESKDSASAVALSEKRKNYEKYRYYLLSMSLGDKDVLYKGSASQADFSAALNRLNFELSNYIYGIGDSKDTIYLADYFVPNLYGMGGSTQILLAFPKVEKEGVDIVVNELGFGIGKQKFHFEKKDLDRVPAVNTKSKK